MSPTHSPPGPRSHSDKPHLGAAAVQNQPSAPKPSHVLAQLPAPASRTLRGWMCSWTPHQSRTDPPGRSRMTQRAPEPAAGQQPADLYKCTMKDGCSPAPHSPAPLLPGTPGKALSPSRRKTTAPRSQRGESNISLQPDAAVTASLSVPQPLPCVFLGALESYSLSRDIPGEVNKQHHCRHFTDDFSKIKKVQVICLWYPWTQMTELVSTRAASYFPHYRN